MVLKKYKIDVELELVFMILGPYSQIIHVDRFILMIKIFKTPYCIQYTLITNYHVPFIFRTQS